MCAYVHGMMYRLKKKKTSHLYHNLNSIVLATDIPKFVKQNLDLVAHACGLSGRPNLLLRALNVQATWNSVSIP